MTLLICSSTGKSITLLGEPIARGGEGNIYRTNQNGYIAKIYKNQPTTEQVQKLAVMIAHPPTDPNSHRNHISFAWPKSALRNAQGDIKGFLMPEVKGGKELIDIYNPQRRKALKLEIDWRFLHTTALNITSIIAALHEAGYVLGDINNKNILVNNQALPSIIDTDSFQVKNPQTGKIYRCPVGFPDYTPPELIGIDFSSLEQTEIHDRFRLALIIYQLLFVGETPFQGKWTGAGEAPQPNEFIRRGLWLYSPNSLIQPVERTISFAIVHPEIQQCFLRCFNDGHKYPHLRPTAKKWLETLRVGNESLTICGRVDSHYYSRIYGKCYWCDRSTKLGVDIFPGVVKAKASAVVESTSQPKVFAATSTIELVKEQGKIITVVGQIVDTHHLSSTNIFFINFGNFSSVVNGYTAFTIVIFSEGLKNLFNSKNLTVSQLSNWVGSYIKITGTLELHQKPGRTTPQIALKDPNQINLINQAEANKLIAGDTNKNTSSPVKQTPSQVTQPPVINHHGIGNLLQTLTGHPNGIFSVAFSPNGQTVASGSSDKTIKLWDVSKGNLLQTLTGHSYSVHSVAFSPDGRTLASGSSDNTIKLWDVNKGNLLQTLTGHSSWVPCVAFSPDGQTLASGSGDNTIKMWDVSKGNLMQTLSGHSSHVHSVAFSADGQTLASGSEDGIKLWNVRTGNLLQTLTGYSSWVLSIAFSPNGQTLASGSSDKTIKLWDVSKGNLLQTLTGHSYSVHSVAFSPDGQTLASGSSDNTIKLWDVKTGNLLQTLIDHSSSVFSVTFSADGQALASGSGDKTIKIWQIPTSIATSFSVKQSQSQFSASPVYKPQTQSLTTPAPSFQQSQSQVSPPPVYKPQSQPIKTPAPQTKIPVKNTKLRNLLLAVIVGFIVFQICGYAAYVVLTTNPISVNENSHNKELTQSSPKNQPPRTQTTQKIDSSSEISPQSHSSFSLETTLTGHSDWVWSITFSPDGQTLASGSVDKTIKLWNVKTGNLLQTIPGHSEIVSSVAFTPDGQTLASGSVDGTIKLWDVNTENLLQTLTGYSSWVLSITFSPDGQTLASGNKDGTIKLWDVNTENLLQTLTGYSNSVWSITFSPDGQTLASGSEDGIKLWNVRTGDLLQTLTGYSSWVLSIAFSPDGQTLASGSRDNTIKLWDVKTGNLLQNLTGHSNSVSSVAFSPDGQILASGSWDNTIKLWDVKTGNLLQTLTGHSELVSSVAFTPDGQTLASGSKDGTIKIWRIR